MMRSPSAPDGRVADVGAQEMRAAATSALHVSSASSSRPFGGVWIASDGTMESEQATMTVAERSTALTRFSMKAPGEGVKGEAGPTAKAVRASWEDRPARIDRRAHAGLQREILEARQILDARF